MKDAGGGGARLTDDKGSIVKAVSVTGTLNLGPNQILGLWRDHFLGWAWRLERPLRSTGRLGWSRWLQDGALLPSWGALLGEDWPTALLHAEGSPQGVGIPDLPIACRREGDSPGPTAFLEVG